MAKGKNNILSVLKGFDSEMKVGMRGSTVTNVRYSTGGPWNPADFDLDVFIQSDKLLAKYKNLINEDGFLKIGGKVADDLKKLYPELFEGLREGTEGFSIKVFSESADLGEAIFF